MSDRDKLGEVQEGLSKAQSKVAKGQKQIRKLIKLVSNDNQRIHRGVARDARDPNVISSNDFSVKYPKDSRTIEDIVESIPQVSFCQLLIPSLLPSPFLPPPTLSNW